MKSLFTLLLIWLTTCAWAQNSAIIYIQQYESLAVKQMYEHGVPASVVLGVAMHESGNGTSRIARLLNNHFGIKGLNTNKEVKSKYKSYDSVALSYADFSDLLKNRKQFNKLFKTYSPYDYKAWVRGLQKGRYAASKQWASQVITIIKKYHLYNYDQRPANYLEPLERKARLHKTTKLNKRTTFYTIKKGDVLSILARKNNTTVRKLQQQNHLKTTKLRIGHKIKIN